MLAKQSIKRPFTVIVVILVFIVIGVMAIFTMPVDLFPSMELPVMVVATVAPGSAPESVEKEITAPLESAVKSVSNVKSVTSVSMENMSMLIVQFNGSVDLNVASADINEQIDFVKSGFDEMVMDPMVIKMDPNMLPIMSATISKEGATLEDNKEYFENVIDKVQAVEGVASVSASGLVDNYVYMHLDEEYMINSVLTDMALTLMEESKEEDTPQVIKDIINKIMGSIMPDGSREAPIPPEIAGIIDSLSNSLKTMINPAVIEQILIAQDFEMPGGTLTQNGVDYFVKVGEGVDSLDELKDLPVFSIPVASILGGAFDSVVDEETYAAISAAMGAEAADGLLAPAEGYYQVTNIDTAGLPTAVQEFISANKGKLISPEKHAQFTADYGVLLGDVGVEDILTSAAGYAVRSDITAYLTEGIEPLSMKLGSMANITVLNNASQKHTIVNGAPGIMLSIMKQPNYSTVDVSKGINNLLEEFSQDDEGFNSIVLFDQGKEINTMMGSIITNLLVGALFAILILALFLKDARPTLTVGAAIFISILTAFAFMYICGVTLNLASMGGLALAVGMLVDNSIVVIENIYRRRREGVTAIQAAYEGTKQVSSAIISSTVTTVIVFLPILFIQGITQQIFKDLALTVAFSLAASLLVALTLVPMVASRTLKGEVKNEFKFITKMRNAYSKSLDWTLKRKWLPLVVVTVLFATSILSAFFMDKEFFPSMESDSININASIDKEKLQDITYDEALSDAINGMYGAISAFDYVADVGVEVSGGMNLGGASIGGGGITAYITMDKKSQVKNKEAKEEIIDALKGLTVLPEGALIISEGNNSTEMISTTTLSMQLSGKDMDMMRDETLSLTEALSAVEGVESVDNGLENPPLEYRLIVDKEKANKYGLYTAQIFMAVNSMLTEPTSNTTVRVDETLNDYDVFIYGFDYDVTRWYRAADDKGVKHRMFYVPSGGLLTPERYYMLSDDNTEQDVTRAGNEFTNTVTGAKYDGGGTMKMFYAAGRKQPIDLVTARIPLTGTNGLPTGGSVMLLDLLKSESFATDENGDIIYRTNENGEYIDRDGNVIDEQSLAVKGVPKTIALRDGYAAINRIDGKRTMTISVEVADGYRVAGVISDIEKLIGGLSLPESIELNFVGENEMLTDTYTQLALVLVLAVLLIYLVMVAQFQSLKSPFIIMFTIPLAFTGSILLLAISGMPLSVFALVGLVVLVGVVVNNGIVFVDYVNKLMLAGMNKKEALLQTAKDRLRPILMTAITTIIAMIATIADPSSAGQTMRPLAVSVVGGLLYATVLTLYVVPVLYDLFNKKERLKVIKFDDDKEDDILKEMNMEKKKSLEELPMQSLQREEVAAQTDRAEGVENDPIYYKSE